MKTEELLKEMRNIVNKCSNCRGINYEYREDIINDVYIKINDKLDLTKEWDDIKNYVFISLRNECTNTFNNNIKTNLVEDFTNEIGEYDKFEFEDDFDYYNDIIQRALENMYSMTPNEKEILQMFCDGMSNTEIGEIKGLGARRVYQIIHYIITKIKTHLSSPNKFKVTNTITSESVMIRSSNDLYSFLNLNGLTTEDIRKLLTRKSEIKNFRIKKLLSVDK